MLAHVPSIMDTEVRADREEEAQQQLDHLEPSA